MNSSSNEPVVIVGNKQGGVVSIIDNPNDPRWRFHIMLRQGDRYAHMLATEELIAEVHYEPGQVIEGGRILVKEQLEQFEPNDSLLYLKMKDNKVCRKNGQPIYQKKYFTHDNKKSDIIIQED